MSETSSLADMQAVRLYAAKDLRVETIAMAAEPRPDEVRVRVAFAGLCGSDIHNFKTGQWISRSPSVAGHEFSGWVEALGSDVEGFSIGDTVVVDSRFYCGSCANCRDGKANLCESLGFVGEAIDGGFAQYATLPARLVLKCESGAAMDVLALAEPLAVALHAIARLNLSDGAPLLVIGCGPIGALSALVASLEGPRTILVADRNGERADAVCKLSGAQALPLSERFPLRDKDDRSIRHVLDTTGSPQILAGLVELMSGATIGLVGIGFGDLSLDPVQLVEKELCLVGCHAYEGELEQACALLQNKPELFRPVIGNVTGLDAACTAYDAASSGASASIKTLFSIADHAS